jgi:phosphatidate cytidylyltransferase
MHRQRIITAAIVLPLAVLYVMLLPPIFFTLLLCAAAAIGVHEFYTMYKVGDPYNRVGIGLAILIPLAAHLPGGALDYLALAFIVLAAIRLFAKRTPEDALKDTAPIMLGMLYIPPLLAFQAGIRAIGPEWIIFLYGTIWGADSAAYYIGKNIGKKKLYESMSPNKTVEGGVASVVGGALCALILSRLLGAGITPGQAMLIGTVIGAVTIVGDLVESMFKRDAGVKDSGTIIPGHGGVLDKIDGVLFAGPVLYWALRVLGISP